jgi:hypothetical protein
MRKFSVFILAILLLAISLSLTSCDSDDVDNFVDHVILSALGEESNFGKLLVDYTPFSMCGAFVDRLANSWHEFVDALKALDWSGIKECVESCSTMLDEGIGFIINLAVFIACFLVGLGVDVIILFTFITTFMFAYGSYLYACTVSAAIDAMVSIL